MFATMTFVSGIFALATGNAAVAFLLFSVATSAVILSKSK
jgi:hypothetical protein